MDRLPSVGEFSTIGKIWRKFEKNKVLLELTKRTILGHNAGTKMSKLDKS